MRDAEKQIEQVLVSTGASIEVLGKDEHHEIDRAWLSTFAQRVKQQTGRWIYEGYRWHGFSNRFEDALEGRPAKDEYFKQWTAPYVVFDEKLHCGYRCTSRAYPDFSKLRADIYVAHHNMKWSMVFTHEQPDIGPFFAVRH